MASNELNTSVAEFEDDLEPDLDISHGKDKVWLVKLPKWLIEHWSKVDQDNLDLARITIPYGSARFLNLLLLGQIQQPQVALYVVVPRPC